MWEIAQEINLDGSFSDWESYTVYNWNGTVLKGSECGCVGVDVWVWMCGCGSVGGVR